MFTLLADYREKTHVVCHDDNGKSMNGEKMGKEKFSVGRVVKKMERHD